MAATVNRRINIFIDQAAADAQLKKLQATADKLTHSIAAGQAAGKNMAAEIRRLADTRTAITQVQAQVDSGLKPSFNQLRSLVQQLERELRKLPVGTQEFIDKMKELERARGQFSQVANEVRGVQSATNSLKLSFKEAFSLGGIIAIAQGVIAGAASSLINFFKGAVDEAIQAEDATVRLKNKLTNLGNSDAFDRLSASADKMANTFKFIDNDEVLSIFSQLIDYGKLTEIQMKRLVPVIIDFATNARISVEEATKLIIGGLEGQGKALKQYGINIKDAASESERFGLIVDDLGDKVKGSGEAFGSTFAGGMATARQEMKNLQEDIGNQLIPILNRLLKGIKDSLSGLASIVNSFRKSSNGIVGAFAANTAQVSFDAIVEFDAARLQEKIDAFNKLSTDKKKKALADEEDLIKRSYQYQVEAFKNKNNDLVALQTQSIDKSSKLILEYRRIINDDSLISTDPFKPAKTPKTPKPIKDKDPETDKKEVENILEKVREAVRQHRTLIADAEDSDLRKQINKIKEFYKEKLKLTQENAELTRQLETLLQQEINEAIAKDAAKKAAQLSKSLQESNARLLKLVNDFKDNVAAVAERDKLAGLENNVTKAGGGKAKLNAQIALLEEQKKNELDNANLTNAEREKIELDFQTRINELRLAFEKSRMDAIIEYAQTAVDIMKNVFEVLANKENGELARDRKVNDEKRKNLQSQLNNKIISQQEYTRQLDAINAGQEKKEEAAKKKQFERAKKLELISAGIGIAQAIISTLAARPGAADIVSFGVARSLQVAFIAAAGLAQLAAIASKKYAKGGLMDGPAHSDGGMPIINPRTGHKVAEIEGGEAILSRATVRNNPDLVSRLLHTSLNRGGERIRFPWDGRAMQSVNYSTLTDTVRKVKRYETGGVFDTTGTAGTSTGAAINNELLERILIAVSSPGRSYVVLNDITTNQDQLNRIVDDAKVSR